MSLAYKISKMLAVPQYYYLVKDKLSNEDKFEYEKLKIKRKRLKDYLYKKIEIEKLREEIILEIMYYYQV